MSHRLVIPLVALIAFGAGYGARVWTDRDQVIPPPPAAGSEFVRSHPAPNGDGKAENRPSNNHAPDRAKLIADIEKVRPQIESYRKQLEEIDGEFDRGFVALLKPEQRERYDAQQRRDAEKRAKNEAKAAADISPLSDEQIAMLQQRPLWNALFKIAVSWRLERAVKDYKLDAAQQAEVRALLEKRRDKFIAIVDATPPPSITLSSLANQTQKLAEPAKHPSK
jgi:hypothetical protein